MTIRDESASRRHPGARGRVRWWLVGLVGLVAGCATPAAREPGRGEAASEAPSADRVTIRELRPGVWVHTSWQKLKEGPLFPSNGLIVRDGDGLVVVDTAWGNAPTRVLLARIEQELRLPVRSFIGTHFHDDRVGGAEALAERGITLRTTPQTRAMAAPTVGEKGLAALRDPLAALAVGEAQSVGPLEVFYPGPGHSADNLVVWVPAARILFGGCAIKSAASPSLGNVADAAVKDWPDAVRRVQARYSAAEVVVPGHGDPGDTRLLAHTLELLAAVPAAPLAHVPGEHAD